MVKCSDGTAQGIYKALQGSFEEHSIPIENIVRYSSDTTNAMFGGGRLSVSALLKTDFPHVITVKCSCDLIHAAGKLPECLEDLVRDIFAHFTKSAKRQEAYREFQSFYEFQPKKFLSPAQTGSLSLQACINSTQEQYEALKSYFLLTAAEDPTHSNDRISQSLCNKFKLAYLELLSYPLNRLNSFNRLFQNEKSLLHILRLDVSDLIKSIALDFMDLKYVKSKEAQDIDPESHNVPLENVYVGMAASVTLTEMSYP